VANKISVLIDVTVDKANTALKNFQTSINDADGAVGKFKAGTASLSTSLKANIMPIAAAAGVAVAAFAAKSVKSASDLEQSVGGVEKAFGSAAAEVLKIGENAAESMGLSERAFNEGALALSAFADDIARDTGEPVAKVIEDLMTRAADFAAAYGTTVPEAVRIFSSTLSGESEPIKKYGIIINETETKAYAASEGIEDLGKSTQRAGLLMQETAKFAGQFADEGDTLAGSQERLAAKIENFQAQIGEELLPTVATAVGIINDLAGSMENLGFEIGGVNERLGENRGFWDNVTNSIQNQLNPVQYLGQAYNELDSRVRDIIDSGADTEEQMYGTAQSMVEAEIKSALLEGATKDLEAADKDAEQAAKDRTEAIDRATAAINEARTAQEALTEAVMEAGNSDLAYRNQVAATSAAIAENTLIQIDATRSDEERAQAARDTEAAVYDQAAAFVQMKDDQAAASGETYTAEQKAFDYRSELARLVADLNGPAAEAIRGYIRELDAIPRSIYTVLGTIRGGDLGQSSTPGAKRASGGPVSPGGTYLVGENGPELLQMGAESGHVTNAAATSGLTGLSADGIRAAVSAGMVDGWKRVEQMRRAS